jgi:hypothetical protein
MRHQGARVGGLARGAVKKGGGRKLRALSFATRWKSPLSRLESKPWHELSHRCGIFVNSVFQQTRLPLSAVSSQILDDELDAELWQRDAGRKFVYQTFSDRASRSTTLVITAALGESLPHRGRRLLRGRWPLRCGRIPPQRTVRDGNRYASLGTSLIFGDMKRLFWLSNFIRSA